MLTTTPIIFEVEEIERQEFVGDIELLALTNHIFQLKPWFSYSFST